MRPPEGDPYPKIFETPYGTLVLEEPTKEAIEWARESLMKPCDSEGD